MAFSFSNPFGTPPPNAAAAAATATPTPPPTVPPAASAAMGASAASTATPAPPPTVPPAEMDASAASTATPASPPTEPPAETDAIAASTVTTPPPTVPATLTDPAAATVTATLTEEATAQDEESSSHPPDDASDSDEEAIAEVHPKPPPNLNQVVATVKYKGRRIEVTQRTWNSMTFSINMTENQPTPYFKCRFIVQAVSEMLEVDFLKHSMPQTAKTLEEFDWGFVVPEDPTTYPKGEQPTSAQFKIVGAVHKEIKEKKDKIARQWGLPKSGVQSHCTYVQRWKQWRDWMAVYRHMYPNETRQMALDTMTISLKLKKSVPELQGVIRQDIIAFLARRSKQAAEERALSRKLKLAQQMEEEAKKKRLQAEALEKASQKEQQAIQKKDDSEFGSTARQAEQRKRAALEAKKAEEEEAKKLRLQAKKAERESRKEREALEKKQRSASRNKNKSNNDNGQSQEQPQAKKFKHTNYKDLILKITPRNLANKKGDHWKPPTRSRNGSFEAPGYKWKERNLESLRLLFALGHELIERNMMDAPLTFNLLMEHIDDEGIAFEHRLFMYLIAMILHEKSDRDVVIDIVKSFIEEDLYTPDTVKDYEDEDIQDIIDICDDQNQCGAYIRKIAKELVDNHDSLVPTSKDVLTKLVGKKLTAILMQYFGSTELVIGQDIRKVVVALDMFDWEDSGAKAKTDVKLSEIKAEHVEKSLNTWLPIGKRRLFQDMIESIGNIFATKSSGFWGHLKDTIDNHFSAKEKTKLNPLVVDIYRFYCVVKLRHRPDLANELMEFFLVNGIEPPFE